MLYLLLLYCLLTVVIYALSSLAGVPAGQLSKDDKARFVSLFRKAFKRGFCCQTFSTDKHILGLAADKNYFVKCLIGLLINVYILSYPTTEIVK